MNATSETAIVTLPGHVVAEIESVESSTDLESFVHQAVHAYVATIRHQTRQEQLARDYDELARLYPELALELADEVWLQAENEALLPDKQDGVP